MADADTEVTLDEIQAAVTAAVSAAFPAFKTVEFDRDDEGEDMLLPACLMEFIEAEPAPELDAGTGQWPALARFDARILLPARKTAKSEVKKAAVALAAWFNLRRFPGVSADPCQVIACEPDEFSPAADRFRVWRVEWVIPAMFGESVWGNDGDTPGSLFSFVPYVGTAHEADYSPIEGPIEVDP